MPPPAPLNSDDRQKCDRASGNRIEEMLSTQGGAARVEGCTIVDTIIETTVVK
ncbi:MAG TPA: hypothetical protein PKC98_20845 [Candidatus Melainabacteria bacterium]|nr:hypothetical protein [Candidatus Melainabacteria bacterium]